MADGDTVGCLCLVASYTRHAGRVASVTARAAKQIDLTPLLSDVIELRFVDLGPEPGQVGDRFRPVRRVTAELSTQGNTGRTHFALLVIGKSAVNVEELLGSCAAEPLLAGLRMRSAGIASREDRPAEGRTTDIVSSPTGTWEHDDDLVKALLRQVEHLWRHVATCNEPGLAPAERAALQQAHGDHGSRADADDKDGSPLSRVVVPDILDTADPPEAQDTPEATDPAVAAERAMARWRPGLGWRRHRAAALPTQPTPAPQVIGLVYLLVVAEQGAMPDPGLGRLQDALLALDKKLASQSACRYQVKLVSGDETELRGELVEAGRLSRRDGRRSVKIDDFAVLLKWIRSTLRRDDELVATTAKAANLATARPAVVIFAPDPPITDRSSSAAFRDLAAETTVVWVVPRNSEELVSPTFAAGPTVTVLHEFPAVADDIWYFLRSTADCVTPASTGAPSA